MSEATEPTDEEFAHSLVLARRSSLVSALTAIQAELTAVENAEDDDDYFRARTELVARQAAITAELLEVTATVKAFNIAKSKREFEAAQARKAAGRAQHAADEARRRSKMVIPPPTGDAPAVVEVDAATAAKRAAGLAEHQRNQERRQQKLAARAAATAGTPGTAPKGDLGRTVLKFAKGMRWIIGRVKNPLPHTIIFKARLEEFIAAQKQHIAETATAATAPVADPTPTT